MNPFRYALAARHSRGVNRERASGSHLAPLRCSISPPGPAPLGPAPARPHALDDPLDGGAQEGGLEVPQHGQPALLGRAVQAHVAAQGGRRPRRPAQQRQQHPRTAAHGAERSGSGAPGPARPSPRRRARPGPARPEASRPARPQPASPRRPVRHASEQPQQQVRGTGEHGIAPAVLLLGRVGESPSNTVASKPRAEGTNPRLAELSSMLADTAQARLSTRGKQEKRRLDRCPQPLGQKITTFSVRGY